MPAKLLLLGVCIYTLLALVIAAAPGDESAYCLEPSFQIQPPTVPPDVAVFMDSRYYNNLLGSSAIHPVWVRPNRGGAGKCGHGLGGVCQREVRCCTFRTKPEENYVITQYIKYPGVNEVFVDIKFAFSCPSGSDCIPAFDILYYETDFPSKQERKKTTNYEILEQVDHDTETFLTLRFIPRHSGGYIMIRENGTCVTIKPVRVYTYKCSNKIENLVEYPTTYMPSFGSSEPTLNTGKCLEHSSQDGGRVKEPTIKCFGDGFEDTECLCDPGYFYEEELCNACSSGTYKNTYSNTDGCEPCPANSVSGGSAAICECSPGYYRTSTEGPDVDCTEPPSGPRNCQASAVSDTSISLQWNAPTENGGRSDVQYNVSYQRSDSLRLGYDIAANNLEETSFEITGLNPLTDYKVEVCAENGVSSQSPLKHCCVIDAKTTVGVPEKITVFAKRHGNTLTWQTPPVTNGNLTGFVLRIFFEGSEEDANVIPLEPLDFCYSPIPTEVPPGTGEVFVQVCAKTVVGCGEWSDAIHYKTVTISQELKGITIGFQQPTFTVVEGSDTTPVRVTVVDGTVGELGFEPKVVLTLQSSDVNIDIEKAYILTFKDGTTDLVVDVPSECLKAAGIDLQLRMCGANALITLQPDSADISVEPETTTPPPVTTETTTPPPVTTETTTPPPVTTETTTPPPVIGGPPPSTCPDYEDCSYEFCSQHRSSACIKSRDGCNGGCEVSHCRACYQTVADPESSACDSEQCTEINSDNPSDRCLRTWGLCVRRNFPGFMLGTSASFDCVPHPCL